MSWFFAESADSPEIASSCSTCCRWRRSTSSDFFSTISSWEVRFSLMASASFFFLWVSSSFWERANSFCLILFSACPILLFFSFMTFSCSVFSWRNLSLAWRIFSFLMTSASASASPKILLLLFLNAICQTTYETPKPNTRHIPASIIVRPFIVFPTNAIISRFICIYILIKNPQSFPNFYKTPFLYGWRSW